MSCSDWEEKLNAAQDGELGAADRAALDAHLAACPDCHRTQEVLAAQDRELDAAFAPARSGEAALVERISRAVRAETASRRRPRLLLVGMAAAAALLLVLLWPKSPPRRDPLPEIGKPRPLLAHVTTVIGPAEADSGAGWAPLRGNQSILPGDRLRTPARSKVELWAADGSRIRLNENTEILFEERRRIRLKSGELYLRASKERPPFCVETEQARVTTEDGTLDLSHTIGDPKATKFDPPSPVSRLLVVEGKIELHEQEVPPAMTCMVAAGVRAPAEPADVLLKTKWIHELLQSGEDPEGEILPRIKRLVGIMARTKMSHSYEQEVRAFGERAVPALLAIVQNPPPEFNVYDRRNAARLLSQLAGASQVPTLLALASDADPEVAGWAMTGLSRITGRSEPNAEAWRRWLEPERPKK